MKFYKKIKPSKVLAKRGASKYQSRAIEGAMVEVEPVPTQIPGGSPSEKKVKDHLVLYATNSFCFVRIDLGVKETLDEPGPIPAAALRHMERGVEADLGMDRIRVGITHYDRVFAEPSALGTEVGPDGFPDWAKVLEKAGARISEPSGSNHLTLNLNPKLLLAVAEAIGEPEDVQITVDLRQAKEYPRMKRRWLSGPLRVQAALRNNRTADAYLMPIKPEGHSDEDESGGAFPG